MSRRLITTGLAGLGPLPHLVRERAGEAALERLLATVEVPVALLDRPQARLPLIDMATVFDRAAAQLGDPWLGLTVGRGMQPEDYGTWVRYAVAGPTLGQGLVRLCRAVAYYQSADSLRGEVHGELVRIAYHPLGVPRDRGRQHADHVLPPLIAFVRRFLGARWQPLWVEMPYAAVAAGKDLAARIGVEVRFDRPGVALVFDRAALAVAGHAVPPGFAALRQLVRGGKGAELTRALIDVVELRLSSGMVGLDGAAARLGLSPRSLQRHLRSAGICYRQVVDSARRDAAELALATTPEPLGEIATRLGYAEPAHFTRAFRRWHGCCPSMWRRTRLEAGE